jgi:hypothetical protein
MAPPSTAQVLASRGFNEPAPCEQYIDWAIGRLESGDDTPHLCMLAGMTPSDDPRELDRVFEITLNELGIPSVRGDPAIKLYAAELLSAYLRGEAEVRGVLEYLGHSLGWENRLHLQDFYQLYCAFVELEKHGYSYHWLSATRENIHEIVRTVAQAWLAEHVSPLVAVNPAWLAWHGGAIVKLAQAVYEQRELPSGHLDTARLAVLADMLEEAGCTDAQMLGHLRSGGPHVRGCWALDLLLGKE